MSLDAGSITGELLAITHAAQKRSSIAKLLLMEKRQLHRAYRETFFDQDGRLKPAAQMVLSDLAEMSGIGMAASGLEHEELACLEGRRRMFLHLLGRFKMNSSEIINLERDIAKENHDV